MNLEQIKEDTFNKVKENYKPNSPKKKIMLGVIVVLLGALGLEVSNNDWDLGKLIDTKSFSESKVMRDKEGNIVTEGGKYEDEYNCDDFTTKTEAQRFYEKAGGIEKDFNRLDGNKDGEACENLPKSAKTQ